ncbi:MAG: LTA synthase family protein [Paludibacteraceae bacterium]|nr:LTA synthase family protein [Paludibacteraceae bacterium]
MNTKYKKYSVAIGLCILLWGAVFCGMRGSFQRYPLRVSFAYFCNSPFYNKLGVNPLFNIIKSAEYGKIGVPNELAAINEKEALDFVQHTLNIAVADSLRPINRAVIPVPQVEGHPNVVLIFMESMTSANLERKGKGQWLTPFLRSLRDSSVYFSHCYSAGIHTNNGIVATHYGFVPNFAKTIMDVNADRYTGLPYYLQKAGYRTMCFITGNPQYDNMNSFWRDNSIEDIYSLYDYPHEKIVNNFGVADDYLFEFGLNKLNELSADSTPFFASFLTVSNHGPFVVPQQYINRGEDDSERIIAFADDALKNFIAAAQQTQWGNHTLFVLVADHGASLQSPYDMVLTYNTIPAFIFGAGVKPQIVNKTTSQIDIYPTVLSMLGVDFDNNCLGIDVLNDNRDYAFFVSNEHLGVADTSYFYCYSINSRQERLYRIGSNVNLLPDSMQKANEMRTFGMNMLRVNLMAIDNKWTTPCE